ncbi:hypothetical protein C7M84_011683 [Penaeus vannamei]|uniref:Uncharacterized protein n=1 Tax=Penaeus vannamei TaxID=6689 RepID=A0A3R7Q6X2_PENVA|nr:hypothetical protein C7M84_011683 [Penaeus vannamei]
MRTGTLLLVVAAALSAAAQEGIPTEGKLTPTEAPREFQTLPPSNCRYYCAYEGIAYCCDDGTRPSKLARTRRSSCSRLANGHAPCASDGYCAEDEKCCPTPCARKHLCLAAAAQEKYPVTDTPPVTACRYYCGYAGVSYCCDGGLAPDFRRQYPTQPPSNCRYFCGYEGDAYCCDDGTRPIPQDHDENAGVCIEMSEHICEDDAIYYNTTDGTGANTTKQLFSGSPTATPPCASDGYCAEDEKCCPTPCARKHLCLAAAAQENAPIEKAPTAEDDLLEFPTIPPNTCRYYCSYDNTVYCCDDGTRPLPPDHYAHQGMCVAKEEHICKSDGIYYKSEKATIEKLFSGSPVTTPPCASDGYCAEDEKCCPTPCAKKHHCLKYVPYPSSCRYYCFWDSESYCCDDGSLLEPKNHDDHEGLCPKIEDEDCDGDREVPIKFGDKGYKQKAAACASDGYCARDEKCCPSKCAQRHVCLKANRIVEEIDGSGGAQELDF